MPLSSCFCHYPFTKLTDCPPSRENDDVNRLRRGLSHAFYFDAFQLDGAVTPAGVLGEEGSAQRGEAGFEGAPQVGWLAGRGSGGRLGGGACPGPDARRCPNACCVHWCLCSLVHGLKAAIALSPHAWCSCPALFVQPLLEVVQGFLNIERQALRQDMRQREASGRVQACIDGWRVANCMQAHIHHS